MLQNMFSVVLNMSITATAAAVLILLLRSAAGRKLPKTFFYAVWIIVLLRLLVPFSIKSPLSLFNIVPDKAVPVQNTQNTLLSGNISYGQLYEKIAGQGTDNSSMKSAPEDNATRFAGFGQTFGSVLPPIWAAGALLILSLCILLYLNIFGRFRDAVLYDKNDWILECSEKLNIKRKIQVYTSDKLYSPVVCGLINTRIIIPVYITESCSEGEIKYIIMHELVHIKRFDYIFKPLSIVALCIHWFNPVIWLSFILSQKDMEMSCDERAVLAYDNDVRKEYASTLIKLSSRQNLLLNGGILAFGESNIKGRIKGIMKFKKPGAVFGTAAIAILIILGIVLLTNRQTSKLNEGNTANTVSPTVKSAENTVTIAPGEINSSDNNAADEIEFAEITSNSVISPSVPENIKPLLQKRIKAMEEMDPGVGPWRIIYCNNDKIIIYNYAHIVAVDISEKNRGIYSVIELKDLKVGSYQGSEIAVIYPSQNAMACILGTGSYEKDIKSDKSIYLCSLFDSSVKELRKNYNLAEDNVIWYRDMPSSTMIPYYISISNKNDGSLKLIWDAQKSRKISSIPKGAQEEPVPARFIEDIGLNTGYSYIYWWQKDDNTVIGAPYKKGISSSGELKLSDFEIIEVNTKDKTGKVLFKIKD